jgi:hypothetical protein
VINVGNEGHKEIGKRIRECFIDEKENLNVDIIKEIRHLL